MRNEIMVSFRFFFWIFSAILNMMGHHISLWPMGFRWRSYVAPSLPARLHVCCCSCRWGRSEHTLQSGQQMSQQSSKRLGDAWVLRSTINSNAPHQLNANCHRSWDSAPPLSSPCPGGLFLSTSAMNRRRRMAGSRTWSYLWLAMAIWLWTILTLRKKMSQ